MKSFKISEITYTYLEHPSLNFSESINMSYQEPTFNLTIAYDFQISKDGLIIHYEEDQLQGEPDDKNFPMISGFRLSNYTRFNGDEILVAKLERYQASVTQSKILIATFDEILEVVRPLLKNEKEAETIRRELEEFPKDKHCSGIISRVRVNDKGQYGIIVSGITHIKSPVGPVALYHRLTIIGDAKVEDFTASLKKRITQYLKSDQMR